MSHLKRMFAVGLFGLVLILGTVAYSVLKTPAEASGPIAAIPLAETTQSSTGTTPSQSATGAASAADATATDVPPSTAAEATAPTASQASALPTGSVVLQIVQDESEVRFVIDEVLNNAPKTVIGTTDQVAGEIAIDPADPTQTRVGIIQVNARTLTTDNNLRNRALKNQILQTDQYELITFTPAEVVGLPESGTIGESYTFQIVGDLTIHGVTRSVTFDVTATASSATRLEGTAATTIDYADYGITIPQVRQVASVADQVRLELDFVATA